MKTAFPILNSSPETKDIFSKPPKIIFRKSHNLKDVLVKTKLPCKNADSKPTPGCEPCLKPRCKTCQIMSTTNKFKSSVTNQNFNINNKITCNSKNVIYQLNCEFCEKQYIGQTSDFLRVRMTGHRFDTLHKDLKKPIPCHIFEHKKEKLEECFKLTGIRLEPTQPNEKSNRFNLRQTELAHQYVLQSRHPTGLNLR